MVQLSKVCSDTRTAVVQAYAEASRHKTDAQNALSVVFTRNAPATPVRANAQQERAVEGRRDDTITLQDRASNLATFAKHASLTVLFAIPAVNALVLAMLSKINNTSLVHNELYVDQFSTGRDLNSLPMPVLIDLARQGLIEREPAVEIGSTRPRSGIRGALFGGTEVVTTRHQVAGYRLTDEGRAAFFPEEVVG